MKSKDFILHATKSAADTMFRFARAIEPSKLDWKPAEHSRSVLDMLQECVQSPRNACKLLSERTVSFDPEAYQKAIEQRKEWTSIDQCEAEFEVRFAELEEIVNGFPEQEMESTIFLLFTQKDHPFWEMMLYPYWNMVWHTGQIAYIQTLYGDTQMH